MTSTSQLFASANHEAAINHFQTLLRTSDAKVREREQVISSLKLEISQLRKSSMGVTYDNFGGGDTSNNCSNSGMENADSILKQSKIDKMSAEIEDLKTFHERKHRSLSLELARVEAAQRTHQRAFQSERESYNKNIQELQISLQSTKLDSTTNNSEANLLKNKNEKLVLRLETVQKYMELLPTREEHMSLDRERTELKLQIENLEKNMEHEGRRCDNLVQELVNRDSRLNELAEAATELRERLGQTTDLLEKTRHQKNELATSLNSEERQQLLRLQNDNKRLKSEIDRSYKLQQAAGERLNTETKDLEKQNTNYRVDLARERAVAETLRQALIDQQETINRLENKVKEKDQAIKLRNTSITELEIDLGDAKNVFKTSETMKEVSAVLDDVSRDICTIMKIIDRQLLETGDKNSEQDIMDVSRLLACSLDTNKAIGLGFGEDGSRKSNTKKDCLLTARDQLTSALALRDEVDKLRLKLSDRWTEHLTNDCQVQ